jgi:hypothetical protein
MCNGAQIANGYVSCYNKIMLFNTPRKVTEKLFQQVAAADMVRFTSTDEVAYIDLAQVREKKMKLGISPAGRLVVPLVTLTDSGRPKPSLDTPPLYAVAPANKMVIEEHPLADNDIALRMLQERHVDVENLAMQDVFADNARLLAVVAGYTRARGSQREPFVYGQLHHLEKLAGYVATSPDPDPRIDGALDDINNTLDWLRRQSS